MDQHWPSDESVASASKSENTNVSSTVLFVRGLSYDVLDDQLRLYFEDVGPVKRAFVTRVKPSNESRGFGFVEYAIPADAEAAIGRFHDTVWMGRKLNVSFALNKELDKSERDSVKQAQLSEEKRIKNREKRKEKAQFKAELREAGIELNPKTPIPQEIVDATAGKTLVITGFKEDVPIDRILASCKRVAPVAKIIYPSVESRPNSYAARVTYETVEAAKAAFKKFNNKELRGCVVKVTVLSGNSSVKAARLILRNLSFKSTEKDLIDTYSKYGKIIECHIPKSVTNVSRGFAFLQFDNIESADKCVTEGNNIKIHGREVVVDWALNKNDYDRGLKIQQKIIERSAVPPTKPSTTDGGEEDAKEEAESENDNDNDNDDDEDNEADMNDDEDAEEEEEEEEVDQDDEDDDEDDDDDDVVKNENIDALIDAAEEDAKHPQKKRESDVEKGSTLFIRNLSFETTEETLAAKFSEFGPVKFCKIVVDKELQRPMGTAFVQYYDKEHADRVLNMYGIESNEDFKKLKEARFKKSSKSSIEVLRVDGRELIIVRAVNKQQAKQLEEANTRKREDKRNLYLAREGLILADSEAAEGLSKEDIEKRTRGWNEKREKLKNPNFFVSKVRLSVRNLPFDLDEKKLKTIFLTQVKDALKQAGKKHGGVAIKQAKIVRETDKFDEHGVPKSKGYGFVEFIDHDHALLALRCINNNPTIFTPGRRPIVEFAVDDIRKLMVIEKIKSNMQTKRSKITSIQQKAEEDALKALQGKVNPEDLKKLFTKDPVKRKSRNDRDGRDGRNNKRQRR